MCGQESGRALQGLEEFGGHPVLEKTSFHGITRFNLNQGSKNWGKSNACKGWFLSHHLLRVAQGKIRCIGFQEISWQKAQGWKYRSGEQSIGDAPLCGK